MDKLTIYIDWEGYDDEHPSEYDPELNRIIVNPYYRHNSTKWWFIPLIHEIGHYLINKIFPNRRVPFCWVGKIHLELDKIHVILMDKIFGEPDFA